MGCIQSTSVKDDNDLEHRNVIQSSSNARDSRKAPAVVDDAFLHSIKGRQALHALREEVESPEDESFLRHVRRKSHSFDQKSLSALISLKKEEAKLQNAPGKATADQNLRRLSFKRRGSLDAAWIRTGNAPVDSSGRLSNEDAWGEPSALRSSYDRSSIDRTSIDRASFDRSSLEINNGNGALVEMFEKMKQDTDMEKLLRKDGRTAGSGRGGGMDEDDLQELQNIREERRRKSMNDAAMAMKKGLYSFDQGKETVEKSSKNSMRRSTDDNQAHRLRNLKGAMALTPAPTSEDLRAPLVIPKRTQKPKLASPVAPIPSVFIDHEFYQDSSSQLDPNPTAQGVPPVANQSESPVALPLADKGARGSRNGSDLLSGQDSWAKSSDSASATGADDDLDSASLTKSASVSAKKALLTAIEKAERAAMAVELEDQVPAEGGGNWGSYALNFAEKEGDEVDDEGAWGSGRGKANEEEEDLFDPDLLNVFETAFKEYSAEEWESRAAGKPRRKSIEAWKKAVAKSSYRKGEDLEEVKREFERLMNE